ncbi:MAG: glycosyltransferase family 39 protein [Candidatus Omnitrophica bacterium]|nr:glycosyltransferase family 39 protein [Candidatus Omnitrophota bacterium]
MDKTEANRARLYHNLASPAVLFSLFVLALFLRMGSLDWGLPFRLHPDEWKYVSGGANCHRGHWNPKYFRNPPGFSYLNALWQPVWLKIHTPVEVPEWLGIDPMWLKPRENVEAAFLYRPFDLVLGGRMLSAVMGAMTCIAVFFLVRTRLPDLYALGAALWTAVSFANVRESHFAVNDAAAACLVSWAAVAGLRAYRNGRLRWTIFAAALGGASVAFKYNMFPLILALMGLWGLRFWTSQKEMRRAKRFGRILRDTALIGFVSLLCFLLICPFPIIDAPAFFMEIGKLQTAAAKPWQGQDARWSGVQLAETIWISEGRLVALFALAGLFFTFRRRYWEFAIFPILYVLLVTSHPLFFVRFSLPLLPWIALWGATAVYELSLRCRRRAIIAGILASSIFLLGAVEPLLKDLRSNYLLKQTDSRIEFLHWLRTERSEKALMALDQFSVPLVYRSVADFWTAPLDPRIIYIDSLPSDQLDQLNTLNNPVAWIAVSDFVTLPGYLPDSYEERREALCAFAGNDEPVKIFQPFANQWHPGRLDAEDAYSPFRNLWNRRQPGAVIEIFAKT